MPSTKAEQRVLIEDLIDRCENVAATLRALLVQMHNRRIQPRGPKTSPPVATVRAEIKRLHQQGKNQHEIAAVVGINSGRVNEVLNGVRR